MFCRDASDAGRIACNGVCVVKLIFRYHITTLIYYCIARISNDSSIGKYAGSRTPTDSYWVEN